MTTVINYEVEYKKMLEEKKKYKKKYYDEHRDKIIEVSKNHYNNKKQKRQEELHTFFKEEISKLDEKVKNEIMEFFFERYPNVFIETLKTKIAV